MEFKFRTVFSGNIVVSVIAEYTPAEKADYGYPGYPGCDEDIEICAVIILGTKYLDGSPSENDDADMLEYLNDEAISNLKVEGFEHLRKEAEDAAEEI